MKTFKVLIAAGGTGGHIYPALALADALKRAAPGIQIAFVGTPTGLENKIIPQAGFEIFHLPIGRLNSNVGWAERLKTLILLPYALFKSSRLLRRQKPNLVLGFGGHASGPLLLMAALLRFPNAIWEPNAMPGMANRILSRFADEVWVVFEEARKNLKGKKLNVAGMPVRREIEEMKPLTVKDEGFHILVFGGSQGARGVNNAVLEMIKESASESNDLKVVHQTGVVDFERIKSGYLDLVAKGSKLAGQVDVREYLHDMAKQYAWADLVICRSGTGTLSELAACQKPSILIPLPTSADDHQRVNAETLVNKEAAVMILQKDLSGALLKNTVTELRMQPEKLKQMALNVTQFHQVQAAEKFAQKLVERMTQNASR